MEGEWRGRVGEWRRMMGEWRGRVGEWRGGVEEWRRMMGEWRGRVGECRGEWWEVGERATSLPIDTTTTHISTPHPLTAIAERSPRALPCPPAHHLNVPISRPALPHPTATRSAPSPTYAPRLAHSPISAPPPLSLLPLTPPSHSSLSLLPLTP
eukprot:scaffold21127_cov59-Isochrysis_galbana.AAC.1